MANTSDFAVEKPTVGGYRNTWGGTVNTALDKVTELLALALPVGTIQMYPKATAPAATGSGGTWLICDGSSLVRASYLALFDVLGTAYGNLDGDTFNIPDLRARVPVGYNTSTIGSGVTVRSSRAIAATSGGTEGHILTEAQLAAHSHSIPATTHDHDVNNVTHTHVGLRTDEAAGTEDTTLAISDPGHSHTFTMRNDWGDGNYNVGFVNGGEDPGLKSTNGSSTGVSVSPASHKHTFSTDAVGHGITTTQPEVIGITETAPDTGSSSSHNNMQPFVVVQYIILAKHPTFA